MIRRFLFPDRTGKRPPYVAIEFDDDTVHIRTNPAGRYMTHAEALDLAKTIKAGALKAGELESEE